MRQTVKGQPSGMVSIELRCLRVVSIQEFTERHFGVVDAFLQTELAGMVGNRFGIVHNWLIAIGRFVVLDGIVVDVANESGNVILKVAVLVTY